MVAVAPNEDARNATARALKAQGIQTSMHYPCVADFTAFSAFARLSMERSRSFAGRGITLPLFPTMTEAQVEEVCSALASAFTSAEPAGA
jgi:dTDP-4-amino-4,6-dideoxygalactose transaminase